MLAGGGFDPPTFGLWAQHASPAPPRYVHYTQFNLYKAHLFTTFFLKKIFFFLFYICYTLQHHITTIYYTTRRTPLLLPQRTHHLKDQILPFGLSRPMYLLGLCQ